MDAFELRDQLVAAMPDHLVGLQICTVYDDNHDVYSVLVAPDLSQVEPDQELGDTASLQAQFGPIMRIWVQAPRDLRTELSRLLGADARLSDEDGATIVRTEMDLPPDAAVE